MTKQFEKNQLKQAEMQGNEAQITQEETGSRKMITQLNKKQLKQFKNQSQTGYMQSNEPQIISGEARKKEIPIRQDRIIENQSQSGEMMIKNTQNKKESSKHKSMLSIYKKNIIQTHSQSGRSMIEMLGVLAIIAILSIGGIVGFRLAMNYYQANQIAHEMNMMRTDAQIKIAQGTEKLILGSPYDPVSDSQLGHIQFNDDYPVDFACALADDKDVILGVDCQVANAYYIELQNIPEGVCRPLSELVNGMNNIIAFNVNEKEYPETGKCEAGNGNVLNAVFSAEAVSELKACKGVEDCDESGSTPYCDPSRHVCVRCYEDNQCEHNQYCENNTCVTCESGVWNGEECVECTADDDCTDSDTPKCNTDTNTCVECVESGDCEESLVCRENTCSLCETEDECQAKGTSYHCSNASICIQCLDNQVWDDESKECVECTTDNDCTDTPDTPKCNTTTNQCVECIESTDCADELVCRENECTTCQTEDECQAKGTTYHCSKEDKCIQCPSNLVVWGGKDKGCVECVTYKDCTDTPDTPSCNTAINKCEACPKNSFWDGTKCAPGCKVNANCENGKYCHLGESSSATEQTGVGSCQPFATELKYSKMLDSTTYYGSENSMTWFDACHLCAARANYADDTKCNKPMTWTPDYMADYKIIKCNVTGVGINGTVNVYCDSTNDVRNQELRDLFNVTNYVQIWLGNARTTTKAYDYRTHDKYFHDNDRNDIPNGGHALCH